MALLTTKLLIDKYNLRQPKLYDDHIEKSAAESSLKRQFEEFSFEKHYDIFLSHSYDDSRIIKQIRDMLVDKGYSVYVDWLEDRVLNRNSVSQYTATVLRKRMNHCNSLIYITSKSAENSVWMPWELGYMDALTGRVAVAPILDENDDFEGREYLGLYPYLDFTADIFFIQRDKSTFASLSRWLEGVSLTKH